MMKKGITTSAFAFAAAASIGSGAALAAPKMTDFKPDVHGFKFSNTFQNDVVFDIRTGGLCGGMVYSALDFYTAKKPTPKTIDYRPQTGSVLERHIYGRQLKTFENQLDKWAELNANPGGIRNDEFYRWGIQGFNGGRLEELRALIDSGRPAPLGLWHADGHPNRPGDHQVLAIGYDMGRYNGRFGPNEETFKIFVYDPNLPNRIMEMQPDPARKTFVYTNVAPEHKEYYRWLTYFVDRKYAPQTPPAVREVNLGPNDGLIRELVLEIGTGGDDLRGGNDNASVKIGLFGRAAHAANNINISTRWINNYSQFVSIPLPMPMRPETITSVAVTTNFGGGISGDNWNMEYLKVRARGGGIDRILVDKRGTPLRRFTGEVHVHDEPLRWLLMDLRTGARGLSGGRLNANAIVVSRGANDTFNNFNKSLPIRPNTLHREAFLLKSTRPISSLALICTYGRNSTLPAWDMNSLKLTLRENGRDSILFNQTGAPLCAFGPTKTSYLATIR